MTIRSRLADPISFLRLMLLVAAVFAAAATNAATSVASAGERIAGKVAPKPERLAIWPDDLAPIGEPAVRRR